MQQNTSSEFVGIEKLKARHQEQLADFEKWASQNRWNRFHEAHYDWWVFPVNRGSSYGLAWTVYAYEVEELKKDVDYIRDYLRGVELVAASWGWDLKAQAYLSAPLPGQKWHDWPIRLYKAGQSTQLFGFEDEFSSLKAYALNLIKQGHSMNFRGEDKGWLFTTGIEPK